MYQLSRLILLQVCLQSSMVIFWQRHLLWFFHEGKFTFISSGRTAALEAGNVYGELSAGAVRNKTENQNQTVSIEESKKIIMISTKMKKVRFELSKCTCRLYIVTLELFLINFTHQSKNS